MLPKDILWLVTQNAEKKYYKTAISRKIYDFFFSNTKIIGEYSFNVHDVMQEESKNGGQNDSLAFK